MTRVTAGKAHAPRAVDIDVTASGTNPTLACPFLLGKSGLQQHLRPLAAALYNGWLNARTVTAAQFPSALPVLKSAEGLTGEQVERSLQTLLRAHGYRRPFNFVCTKLCGGPHCHAHSLVALCDQLRQGDWPPPFPKEIKPSIPEIMADLAILLHLSDVTGIPVYQLTSDIKDFFNQLYLARSELHKTGLVTLDINKLIEHAEHLRSTEPDLCNVVESVLGFGFSCGSNVAQRTAHLLIFIWSFEMMKEAGPVVEALRRQHPYVGEWIDRRARQLDPPVGTGHRAHRVLMAQSRLWTASMYTDDSHFAIFSPQLTVLAIRVWYRIHSSLNLTMAIVLKHGVGQQVTALGFVLHCGLGLAYIPQDKSRRAIAQIQQAEEGTVTLLQYQALLGLLQSMLFVMGMRRAATYGLYAPLAGCLYIHPDDVLELDSSLREKLSEWRQRLGACAGAPLLCAVPGMQHEFAHFEAPVTYFLRSDASKTGTTLPGLGGCLGGAYWRYPEAGALTPDELELPIAVLEFVAAAGTLAAFAHQLPHSALVLLEVDAMASAQALTEDAAKSPLMQHVHRRLLDQAAYQSCASRLIVAHIHGEGNVAADAISRGYFDVFCELARQLGLKVERTTSPPLVHELMAELVALRRTTGKTQLGVHNNNMVGSPVAHPALAPSDYNARARPLGMTGSQRGYHPSHGAASAHAVPLARGLAQPQRAQEYQRAGVTQQPQQAQPQPTPAREHVHSPAKASPLRRETEQPAAANTQPLLDTSVPAAHISTLLHADDTTFALRPAAFDLATMCAELTDPTTAQPVRSSAGQATAWRYWATYCAIHQTPPWRLCMPVTEAETLREAVLQAGFLNYCHQQQSLRPRGSRPEALPASASKTLARIRKLHKGAGYPMVTSELVTSNAKRMAYEYQRRYPDVMQGPHRKEPFTRAILVQMLSTPKGYNLGTLKLDWDATSGRALWALVAVLAQAG
ncbi:MAG: hypothetical protein ACO32I_06075, partial [Candidatus Limnocylindrus sp.]